MEASSNVIDNGVHYVSGTSSTLTNNQPGQLTIRAFNVYPTLGVADCLCQQKGRKLQLPEGQP